ncbi:MAG: hypothetical protein PHH60_05525, partial [Candidatus Margulisbacteria bacterium]|nr:hypothetical protein [Candidatus Margulisiibacteriota bacterium]
MKKARGEIKKTERARQFNFSFDFVVEVLFLIIIFYIATVFDRRLGIVFSGTKVAWLRALVAVILGVWAIKIIVKREHRFVRTPLDWPVVTFLFCTTIATLTSVHVYTSLVGFYGRFEGLTTWYLFGLMFFTVTNYIKTEEQLKRIIIAVVSSSTMMAVYSVIQRLGTDPYMWGGVPTKDRVIGLIGQPNFLAAYILMAFFMILPLYMMEKKWTVKEIDWYEQIFPVGYFLLVQTLFLVMIYNLEAYNIVLWYSGFTIITASAILFAFFYDRLHPVILDVILGLSLVMNYVCILFTQSRGGYMGLFTGIVLFAVVAGRRWILSGWQKLLILTFLILLISGVIMSQPGYSPFERFT